MKKQVGRYISKKGIRKPKKEKRKTKERMIRENDFSIMKNKQTKGMEKAKKRQKQH